MRFVNYIRKTLLFILLISTILISSCHAAGPVATVSGDVKYVFFFIGDGMGPVQIHATEAYLAAMEDGYRDEIPGSKKVVKLNFTGFPVQGMTTTYADDRLITDSPSAGTALACGMKTACGLISMSTDGQKSYITIAEQAKAKGMKVGIVTSESIDHATPAVFYAHQVSRYNYYDIGVQLANSNFDYFAGGSLQQPAQRARRRANTTSAKNTYEVAQENGFKIVTSRGALNDCKPGERVIAYNKPEEDAHILHYEIDRPDNCMSLADLTKKGIELLDNENGFFMMVEGGLIDVACHRNDAVASFGETIAFDKAIGEALEFYHEHPNETLIIVTADHETGGMSMGFATTEYATSFEILKNQKMSYLRFNDEIWSKYSSGQWSGVEDDIPESLKTDIADSFGIVYDRLNAYEKNLLEDAYDKGMASAKRVRLTVSEFPQQDTLLYSTHNPMSVTLTHMLDNKAGIGWTTFVHTAIPVEVHAIGKDSELFNGFYDNTDVTRKIAEAINVELNN